MDNSNISYFLKEQRLKIEEANYKERKGYTSHSTVASYGEPSNTIMIQDLPHNLTEDDIKFSLHHLGGNYIAVRLIKDHRIGINKGIAFIDFNTISDAQDIMEHTRGEMNISGYICRLKFGYNVNEEVDCYDADKNNSWRMERPTSTVMLRGVSMMLSDNEVRAYVEDVSRHVVDVKLIRDQKTGMSRGFGFVEFDSVAEAQRWMEFQQGLLIVANSLINLSYTSARQGSTQLPEFFAVDAGDWSCARCGGHNFKRRDFCFKCNLSKTQNRSVMDTVDDREQPGTSPCTTLLLRNIDAVTNEHDIVNAFRTQFGCDVRRCEIVRDGVTNVSRGFAFVEVSSVSMSRSIVGYYEDNLRRVFELCGKLVAIDYAKDDFSTLMPSYKQTLAEQFEDTVEPPVEETSTVAQAVFNHNNVCHKGTLSSSVLPANVKVERRLPESGMSFELVVKGQRCTSVPTNPFSTATAGTIFARPDASKFLYDQSTQYYFDPVTGLYYDSSTKCFFDCVSQKHFSWDDTKTAFVPVVTPATSDPVQKDGKRSKANEAQKVAKEMDKWEKMVNSKKGAPHGSGPKRDRGALQQAKEVDMCHVPSSELRGAGGDVDKSMAAVGCNSGAEEGAKSPLSMLRCEEERLTDWEKFACRLCNRGFRDRVTLAKHRSGSELHHTNLAALKEKMCAPAVDDHAASTTTTPNKMRYRDRAKERRDKFGPPSPPPSSKVRYSVQEEYGASERTSVPAAVDADGDNIGSRLMAKMGWQQGQGLGKQNQGCTELVQAQFLARGAGIGAAPTLQGHPSDSYRDNLRRVMYAKYHDK